MRSSDEADDSALLVDVFELYSGAAIVLARCLRSARASQWVSGRVRSEWMPTDASRDIFRMLTTLGACDHGVIEDDSARVRRVRSLLVERQPELADVLQYLASIPESVLRRVPLSLAIEDVEQAAANRRARVA